MCGIAGIVMKDGSAPDPAVLAAFDRALAHRGPDGVKTLARGPVGLVHRRLSIIDIAGGDQPLLGPRGGALVGNGEIYNFVELRRALDNRYPFRTQSDFEPTLGPLEDDGLDAVAALRGMYTIALHRPWRDDVLIARDPFGIKPLYRLETERFAAFASEPRAFFAAGLARPALVADRRDEFVQLQYTTGADTIFKGVRRLAPGESLRLVGGAVAERRATPAVPPAPAEGVPTELEPALAAFDRAFADSVAVHQRSDVPYGMFLSGGVDSAAVLTMMARLNERPVLAFTCGFDEASVADERAQARAVAQALGAEHVEIGFGRADFWRLLPAIVDAFDEPAADYAVLPTFKLAAEAQGRVKVILSGEGGDELFAGYGRYRYLMKPWWLGGRPPRSKGIFDGLGVLRSDKRDWSAPLEAIRAAERRDGRSPLQVAQATDIAGWLPADLLLKLDRCLMAHGVEGRTPFLDPVVAGLAFHVPDRLKIAGGRGKWLLRQWLQRHCPAADAFGRKKGFTVPVGAWIAAEGKRLAPLVARQPAIAEIALPDAVERLLRDGAARHPRAAWMLLFYALWHRRHVEGRALSADVFAALAP
jgi:asparagine synthase (glutamine-hydrolysing)